MIDLLVAGGGPAGLAAAVEGALAGLETVVVEPRAVPVDKACGEGVMPAGVRALRRLGVSVAGRELTGVRYVGDRLAVRAAFRSGPGRGVRRTELHRALWERARELGVRWVSGRIDGVRQDDEGVRAGGWRARWLVAADGLHSPLRRELGLHRPGGGPRRWGLRRHYRVAPWTDHVEVHWSPWGEAYVTPVDDKLVGVALLSAARCGFETQLGWFPGLRERLAGPAVSEVRGAGPMRQRAAGRVAGRVLLVGDAAGYVDALTGEGVTLALASSAAAVRCVRAGRPQAYEAAWRHLTRRYRALTSLLVRVTARPSTAGRVVPAAALLPGLFRAAVHALE